MSERDIDEILTRHGASQNADTVSCVWCGEPLRLGPPWQHVSDGTTVRERSPGVDDHVALPDRSGA